MELEELQKKYQEEKRELETLTRAKEETSETVEGKVFEMNNDENELECLENEE